MNLTNEDLTQLLQERERKKQNLIEGCRNGDRQAFNQFIRNYQDDIFSHIYQMVGNEENTVFFGCFPLYIIHLYTIGVFHRGRGG